MSSGDDSLTIFEACQKIAKEIPGDFGGGSPVPKTLVMSYLVQEQQLKKFVEIGVYRGRSLFPVAYSIALNDGNSVGVDPYTLHDAKERDVSQELGSKIDSFLKGLDFDNIYRDVLEYRERCGYGESIKIVRETAEAFFSQIQSEEQKFDIAHIDGNHDTKFVRQDFANCYDNLIDGGFIVFDDIDWKSVKVVYEAAKKSCPVVFECEQFGILIKEAESIKRDLKVEKLAKKLKEVYGRTEQIVLLPEGYIPTVSVGVLTYNQAEYIEECLDSVFSQVGDFIMHVVICDDSSTDGTSEKIHEYLSKVSDSERIRVTYIRNEPNIGMVRNFQKLISLLGGSDYFTFCEGDDYYLSATRIAQHIKLQQKNPQYSMTHNRLLIYKQDSSEYEIFEPEYINPTLPTEELVKENVIGNLGGVFYSSRLLSNLKPNIFDMFTGDWMLAIYLSQFGAIGLLNKPLNVYRRHDGGIWSGKDCNTKHKILIDEIDKYNKYLNFTYDEYFSHRRRLLEEGISHKTDQRIPLAIIDDISPHPISGFRYAEFTSILKDIPGSMLFTSGESAHVLGTDNIHDLIVSYKRNNPRLAGSVKVLRPTTNLHATVLYCDFLGNAFWNVVDRAEAEQTPFIFTLYPGGMFALFNEKSDDALLRVMKSPYFRKVIVTQKVTYDYLVNNGFCSADKIENIWGVVVPPEKLQMKIEKKSYGIHKKTLDICFVAHKYSEHGQDKGYDVFVAVAKKLSEKYNYVRFHVVGPWDEKVLDTSGIKNLTFYGTRGQEWFDKFYRDKDIILSPNINSKIFEGSFDGFPTGAATDAALRKVAMFVTDPLELNDNHFIDNKEIVIIKHDVHSIVNKLEYYIEHPDKLQSICEDGYKKTNVLYSYEKQMGPRIRLLKQAINEPFEPTITKDVSGKLTARHRIFLAVRWLTPTIVKKLRRKLQRLWLKLRTV